jgi:membrane-associated phospholipid phosphatase
MPMKRVLIWGVVLAVLAVAGVLLLDRPLAMAIHDSGTPGASFLRAATGVIETATGFAISKWLMGGVTLVAGLIWLAVRKDRLAGWILVFTGASQLTTRLIAGVLKNVFSRPRPFEALASGGHDAFFSGGSSFPSGHAAHFWPLVFAAAIAFPRFRWPLLILALPVSCARVAINDHYLSDVAASAAIAAFVTCGYAALLRSRITPAAM